MFAMPLSAQEGCGDSCSSTCTGYAEKRGEWIPGGDNDDWAPICNKWQCCSCGSEEECDGGPETAPEPVASAMEIIQALESAESASDWATVILAYGDKLLVSDSQGIAFIRGTGCQGGVGAPVAFLRLKPEGIEHLHAFGVKPFGTFRTETADRRAQTSEESTPVQNGGT